VSLWWCRSTDVGRLVTRARKTDGDVEAAARALNIVVTPHAVVLQRVGAALARIEERLAKAHGNGDLQFFNSEYRRRRIEAALAGRTFVGYSVAKARLREAMHRSRPATRRRHCWRACLRDRTSARTGRLIRLT
jgi:hypothetical protein